MTSTVVNRVASLLEIQPATAAWPAEWLPVREISLTISPGSPLDFSGILPNNPIGPANRLTIGADGRLTRAGNPGRPARMMCASHAWSPASGGFPDHRDADIYARQLAMQLSRQASSGQLPRQQLSGYVQQRDVLVPSATVRGVDSQQEALLLSLPPCKMLPGACVCCCLHGYTGAASCCMPEVLASNSNT